MVVDGGVVMVVVVSVTPLVVEDVIVTADVEVEDVVVIDDEVAGGDGAGSPMASTQ